MRLDAIERRALVASAIVALGIVIAPGFGGSAPRTVADAFRRPLTFMPTVILLVLAALLLAHHLVATRREARALAPAVRSPDVAGPHAEGHEAAAAAPSLRQGGEPGADPAAPPPAETSPTIEQRL